ncbi:MAG: tetratricopeptide repeat protein [Acidimicrobiales bacterium]
MRKVPRETPPPRGWGSVARRGARTLGRPAERTPDRLPPIPSGPREKGWVAERWVKDPSPPSKTPRPASGRPPGGSSVPREVVNELGSVAGARQGDRLARLLAEAARAYDHDRYSEARRLLRPLVGLVPSSAAVRELLGLTLYRQGKWREAVQELEAFVALSRSLDQHPVLADCHRALKHWVKVDELWQELRESSPSAGLVAEGRIVAAGALADQGQVKAAVKLLEGSSSLGRRPRLHQLRLSYALADLYERAGETARARELFATIVTRDPAFADASERRAALG